MRSRLNFDIGWRALLEAAVGLPRTHELPAHPTSFLSTAQSDRDTVDALSVRTLLDAILTELAQPPGGKVLMSAINVKNMADIVRAHGLEVVAVDLDPATLLPPPGAFLKAQSATGAQICVTAQLFGAVSEMQDVEALQKLGVVVIEDAAQAFAGKFHTGDPNADISLFSFGPIKRATALGGAIGLFRDDKLAARVRARLAAYPQQSDFWFRKRALKYLGLKLLSLPLPYWAIIKAITILGKDPDATIGGVARSFSGQTLLQAIRRRPPLRMRRLINAQTSQPQDFQTRHRTCRDFAERLPPKAVELGQKAQGHAFWLFPILAPNPQVLISHLRANGFDATRGATSMRVLQPEKTPLAKALMEKIVYLPNPADLAPRQRERLYKHLKDVL
eukprot:s1_g220.t1